MFICVLSLFVSVQVSDAYVNVLFIVVLILVSLKCFYGPGSSVVIATGYGLDGPGIESR